MKFRMRLLMVGSLTFLLAAGAGCSQGGPGSESKEAPVAERTFQTRGVIREVMADAKTAVIRHEDIPGYMPPMTMELNVGNPDEVRALKAGDTIEFQLNVNGQTHWIDAVRKVASSNVVGEKEKSTNTVPSYLEPLLEVGAMFPDVTLLGEDGRTFLLSDNRGKAVALTYVFTRCPLPDFCPRMGQQFALARRNLKASTGATNWQLISISFDAANDTPAVLKRYAGNYRGGDADRWLFSAAEPKEVGLMAGKIGLTVVAETGSYSHNVRTVVLDRRGRLYKRFDGNLWTGAELATAIREAAAVAAGP
jgi:protein SCO1/2